MSVCGIFATPLSVLDINSVFIEGGCYAERFYLYTNFMGMNMYGYECFVTSLETERDFLVFKYLLR